MMTMMMADGQQPVVPQLSSTYPSAPMEYVNLFTNENVKLGKIPPPPPIIKDSYTSFGKLIDPNDVLIRSLESQGIQRLYNLNEDDQSEQQQQKIVTKKTINTNNHKRELKKLNHSILIAYLDLLEILVKAPNTYVDEVATTTTAANSSNNLPVEPPIPPGMTLREQKLNDIELLFINMHHLINELRPHQARDNIRCILEMQKQQRIETANKFKLHIIKIVDLLKVCISSIQNNISNNNAVGKEELKSNIYFEELNSLLKSANKLTKSLDKFNNNNNNSSLLITDEDIEMKNLDDEIQQTTATSKTNANNLNKLVENISNNNNINNKNENNFLNSNNINNKNCELKDLILCGLIDDYLTKENEF